MRQVGSRLATAATMIISFLAAVSIGLTTSSFWYALCGSAPALFFSPHTWRFKERYGSQETPRRSREKGENTVATLSYCEAAEESIFWRRTISKLLRS